MNQRIVAFTGVSGVGKTTFLRHLAKQVDFQHVSAGSLIATARAAAPEGRDEIRYADIDENQRLLIEGFLLKRDPTARLVVLDGHVVIDVEEGLKKISIEVFSALGVSVMVHLEHEPEQIAANRAADTSRSRPTYSSSILERHQEISRSYAENVADILRVPFYAVTHSDTDRLAELLVSVSPS